MIVCLATTILPKIRSSVKLESDFWQRGCLACDPVIPDCPSRAGPTPRGSRMFAQQLRQAIEASPRAQLPVVSAHLWKAYAAGYVSESDAADLSALIEARKAAGVRQGDAPRRLVGSR